MICFDDCRLEKVFVKENPHYGADFVLLEFWGYGTLCFVCPISGKSQKDEQCEHRGIFAQNS